MGFVGYEDDLVVGVGSCRGVGVVEEIEEEEEDQGREKEKKKKKVENIGFYFLS